MSDYADFLASKAHAGRAVGVPHNGLNAALFDFQKWIVETALDRGRAAIFADCGLGKTLMQLEWARHMPGRSLIVAPLCVAEQTVAEGARFGIPCEYARSDTGGRILVTNYEMEHYFNPADFDGVVIDESSILKSYDGKFRTSLIERWQAVPHRLAATATPAPNDIMELGNHAEFLGVMTRTEMLSRFFVHDGGETQKWRLKGHAQRPFWEWVATWAVALRAPSDIGFDDDGFVLPPLRIQQEAVPCSFTPPGQLFAVRTAMGLQERRAARSRSTAARVARVAEIVATDPDRPWLIWCDLNMESDALTRAIPGAVEVRGSDPREKKSAALLGFASGDVRIMVTKPSIAGYGMNWQHCARMAFTGLSDSYEQFYQALRRCWRFGQAEPVVAYVVTSTAEGAVVENIKRKEKQVETLHAELVAAINRHEGRAR